MGQKGVRSTERLNTHNNNNGYTCIITNTKHNTTESNDIKRVRGNVLQKLSHTQSILTTKIIEQKSVCNLDFLVTWFEK